MGTSKEQRARVSVTCKCGCGQVFMAFPVYKIGGGGLRTPQYKRGHHPNCKKTMFGSGQAWNKGLRKETNESVSRQGRKGAGHWNYDIAQNPDWFADDFDHAALAVQFGHKPRSAGNSKIYRKFRMAILERDNFTCSGCGMVADPEEGVEVLNVHHVIPVREDNTRIFDPSNVVTLCVICHIKRHKTGKRRLP